MGVVDISTSSTNHKHEDISNCSESQTFELLGLRESQHFYGGNGLADPTSVVLPYVSNLLWGRKRDPVAPNEMGTVLFKFGLICDGFSYFIYFWTVMGSKHRRQIHGVGPIENMGRYIWP